MKLVRTAWWLAVVLGLATSAQAEECAYAPSIVALTDVVIDNRLSLPRLRARSFGPEAAYLKDRYGDLSEAEAGTLVRELVESGARGANDLYFAWLVTTRGATAAIAEMGQPLLAEATEKGGYSTARALLLDPDGRMPLLDAFAAMPDITRIPSYRIPVDAVIDMPDAFKSELVTLSIVNGHPLLAAGFAASMKDTSAWTRVAAGLDDKQLPLALHMWRFTPLTVGNMSLPRPEAPGTVADPARDVMWDQMLLITMSHPQQQYFMTLVNQTGWMEEGHRAAMTVGAAQASGRLSPKGTLDDWWLAIYRGFIAAGRTEDEIRRSLDGVASAAQRYGRRTIADDLDWILAVDVLGPYLRGDVAAPPAAPGALADAWRDWVVAADAVRGGYATADNGIARVAELMLEADAIPALVGLLEAAAPAEESIAVADDMAQRLDRMCGSYLFHPGEAQMGWPIYKFD